MHAAVLTFPGHFWQTLLCVRRLHQHYPELESLSFVLDDVEKDPWLTYVADFRHHILEAWSGPIRIITTSAMPVINSCVAGWWRQQLVKLTLDMWLPDQQWFVVDGDVIFASRCDIQQQVPISRRGDHDSRWSKMAVNYVRDLLGQGPGYLTCDGQPVITSAVPFRWLDREFLRGLRHHVEALWGGGFLELHHQWFADQTIVADIDPPDRWVMTEWELIECYRRWVLEESWPMHEVGSGYPIDVDIRDKQAGRDLFYHAYRRDSEIGADWFAQQGLTIESDRWHESERWYNYRERNLRA